MSDNYFVELNNVNVNDKIERKGNLSYLSWAWAWGEIKKRHPNAYYTIYENEKGWNYHTDGKTAWVKTGVTIDGLEHIEYLPVMDYRNQSMKVENITSFNVNTSIQRSLTKACARHGLGLYIYAGEDLPEEEKTNVEEKTSVEERPLNEVEITSLVNLCKKKGQNPVTLFKGKEIKDLTGDEYAEAMRRLGALKDV